MAVLLALGVTTSSTRAQDAVQPNAVQDVAGLAITPDGGAGMTLPQGTSSSLEFVARNEGSGAGTWSFSCSRTGGVTCGAVTPASATIAAGATRVVEVAFTATTAGAARITLTASPGGETGFTNVTVVGNVAPTVSFQPTSRDVRKVDGCVASCFDMIWSHATPAFFSMDAPRSFGLTYSSAMARSIPVVLVDVTPAGVSSSQPSNYKLEVRLSSNNTLLTLSNGATAVNYKPSPGQTTRLAAAIDAQLSGLAAGFHTISLTVTTTFPSGSPATTSVNLGSWMVFNSRASTPFGTGFWPAGVQEYLRSAQGHATFIESDGSITRYANSAYFTPGGTTAAYSSDNATWVRRTYLDGSFVEFDWATSKMTKSVDRSGNTTRYFWTGQQLDSIKEPLGKAIRLTYTSGKLATVTDPTGRITRYTVNASGRLVTIQDPDNVSTTLGYDSNGLLTSVTGRNGSTWNYAYDALSRLRAVTAPSIPIHSGGSGRPSHRQFAPELRVWQPAIPGLTAATAKAAVIPDSMRGLVTVRGMPFDSILTAAMLSQTGLNGFAAAAAVDGSTAGTAWTTNTAVAGAWLQIDVGAGGRALTGMSLHGGCCYTGEYDVQYSDNASSWTTVGKGFGPGSGWRSTRWSYAGAHRYWRLMLSNQPGSGPAITELVVEAAPTVFTAYAVDKFGAPTRIIDPLRATTVIARDTASRPTLVTVPSGHRTRMTYTGFLLTKMEDLTAARTVNYTYNSRNDVQTMTGDVERRDFFYYSGGSSGPAGSLDRVYVGNDAASVYPTLSAGAVRVVKYAYNPRGQPIGMWRSADGVALESRSYDLAGNLEWTQDVRGFRVTYARDDVGRVDTLVLPGAGRTVRTYGPMNQILSSRDHTNNVTVRQYNADFSLKRLVDPKGQVYKWAYNALGLVTAKHDLGDTTKTDAMKYDLAGNLRSIQTRRGDAVTMTYDAVGRMLTRSGPDFPTETFRYDSAGRWRIMSNANAYDSISFDPRGRFVSEWQSLAGATHLATHSYNSRDKVTHRTVLSGGGVYGTRYAYDGLTGVLDTVCALADCAAVDHTSDLYPSFVRFNSGSANEWHIFTAYATSLAASSQTLFPNVPALDQFEVSWTRDSLDYIKSRTPPIGSPGTQRSYKYSVTGRLLNACDLVGGQCLNVETSGTGDAYSYDAAGNRTDAGVTTTIVAGNRITRYGCTGIGYDANGNVTSKQPVIGCQGDFWTYTWDALSRLKEVKQNGVVRASFLYDAGGRRVAKTTAAGTQRYVYDLDHVMLDLNGSNAVVTEYSYYPGVDRLFRVKTAGTTAAVIQDPHTGTVRGLVTFGSGAWIKRYGENPWGKVAADTGLVVRHRFAGRELDQETGLYFMRARYLDPQIGRFLSEDPAGLSGGPNLYEYAGSNPANYSDPTGGIRVYSNGGGYGGGSLVSTPGVLDEPASGLVPGSALWAAVYLGDASLVFNRAWVHGSSCSAASPRGNETALPGWECAQTRAAISILIADADRWCRVAGNRAQEHLNKGFYYYDATLPSGTYARTTYHMNNPELDPRIVLGPWTFRGGDLTNTISHEEMHLLFPFAPEDDAKGLGVGYDVGAACDSPL